MHLVMRLHRREVAKTGFRYAVRAPNEAYTRTEQAMKMAWIIIVFGANIYAGNQICHNIVGASEFVDVLSMGAWNY